MSQPVTGYDHSTEDVTIDFESTLHKYNYLKKNEQIRFYHIPKNNKNKILQYYTYGTNTKIDILIIAYQPLPYKNLLQN